MMCVCVCARHRLSRDHSSEHLLIMMDDDVTTYDVTASPCDATPTTESPPHAEFYELSRFVTGLVIYPIICVVGLAGNSLALVVFSRPSMITSYNVLLAVMAANDLVKLLNDLLYSVHVILLVTDPPAANRLLVHAYPASHYIFNQVVELCFGLEEFLCCCFC